ncbi:hypothetical protein QJS66_03990 [Kocuria rhizophila]|nr:hypothetical protein QJS66_03990 [Kocuria rhizophila]
MTPPRGKNLVGSFHPPAAVVCSLDSLATLPTAAHGHGRVVGPGSSRDPQILSRPGAPRQGPGQASAVVRELVERSVRVKAEVVLHGPARVRAARAPELRPHPGPRDRAQRALPVAHGAAVSSGHELAAELGRAAGVLTSLGLPVSYRADQWPGCWRS